MSLTMLIAGGGLDPTALPSTICLVLITVSGYSMRHAAEHPGSHDEELALVQPSQVTSLGTEPAARGPLATRSASVEDMAWIDGALNARRREAEGQARRPRECWVHAFFHRSERAGILI